MDRRVIASVNKIFHFALKCNFIAKTIRCFGCTMYKSYEIKALRSQIPGGPKLYTN